MNKEKNDKILRFINIGLIVFNTLIMLFLCRNISLHYDEAYTIGMINRNYMDIVEVTSNDVHSPLYYFILKAFCDLFGIAKIQMSKVFSVLCFEAFLILGSWFCRKNYNPKVEMYWLILAGFMPPMIIQATNVRMYALGVLMFTLTGMMAYEVFKTNRIKYWILFTISSVITMYLHTFCMIEVFLLYIILFIAILRQKKMKSVLPYVISGATAALSFVPWLVILWHQMRRWAGVEAGWGNTLEELTFYNVDRFFAEWFSNLERPQSMAVLFGVGLLIYISYYTRTYVKETKDRIPNMGLLIAGIVTAIGVIVSVYIVPCFLGRYVFPVFGLVWLFVAIGLDRMEENWKKIIIVLAVFLCGFFAYKAEYELEVDTELKQYIEFVEENVEEGDVVMFNNYHNSMVSIYAPGKEYMIYGHKPVCMPFEEVGVFKEWEQLDGVDTVWYITFTPGMAGMLGEYYTWESVMDFDFSYYTVYVEKATRN